MNVAAPATVPLLMRANPDGSGHAIEKPSRKRKASPEKTSIPIDNSRILRESSAMARCMATTSPLTSASMETSNSWLRSSRLCTSG